MTCSCSPSAPIPTREWHSEEVLTYHGGRDGPNYRLLLHHLREGKMDKVAFVRPGGASWPLPLYDLALMTAAECAAHNRSEVELSLIAPEEEPLGIFGNAAQRRHPPAPATKAGVTLYTSSYGVPNSPGRLDVSPGDRSLTADRIVTEPRLVGPSYGVSPADARDSSHTDAQGRVPGLDDVFAAGDATTSPVKQGGLAAQQADAVAEAIAASAGADIDPQPFRPVLRGVLLTGGPGPLSARGHQRRGGRRLDRLGRSPLVAAQQALRTLPRSLPQQPDRRGQRRHAPRRARDPRRDRPRAGGAGQAEHRRRALTHHRAQSSPRSSHEVRARHRASPSSASRVRSLRRASCRVL